MHSRAVHRARGALLVVVFGFGCSSGTDDGSGAPAPGTSGASTGGGTSSSGAGGGNAAGVSPVGGAAAGSNSGGGGTTSGGMSGAGAGTSAGGSSETTGGGGAAGGGGSSSGGSSSGGSGGAGGQQKSAGCSKPRTLDDGVHMVQSGGAQRSYRVRAPSNYDNNHAYRLMLDFHGATGSSNDIAPSYFGLWDLAENSTIFAAPDAVGGIWKADSDTTLVSDLLKQLEGELCIDKSEIGLEGFSQGGAMTWTLACALPDTFRFAVVHSGGGLAMPKTCQPIPFLSSLGHDGSGQGMSSDFFATTNGCSVQSLPLAPTGGHACTDYSGCSPGHHTRWCAYDGGHTPAPTDAGQGKSWMPQEVWSFVKEL